MTRPSASTATSLKRPAVLPPGAAPTGLTELSTVPPAETRASAGLVWPPTKAQPASVIVPPASTAIACARASLPIAMSRTPPGPNASSATPSTYLATNHTSCGVTAVVCQPATRMVRSSTTRTAVASPGVLPIGVTAPGTPFASKRCRTGTTGAVGASC